MKKLILILVVTLVGLVACDDDSSGNNSNNINNVNNSNNINNVNNTNNINNVNNSNNINNVNNAIEFETIIEVGPLESFTSPCEVPWESLTPSTLVLIHHRSEPYPCKFALATAGSENSPLVIRGVPSTTGELPVITGDDAVTPLALDYWNEVRSVIKVGGVSHSSDFPSYISIENLEIRSARPLYSFTNDSGGGENYSENAASIQVEEGDHITIKGCILTDSGNGFFAGSGASNLLLDGNYIYGNGIDGSIYQHNNYTEAMNITFQFNRFGPLRSGCLGNNLKDRSAGTVIRFNWIEAGNRTMDLVDSGNQELLDSAAYRNTFVYGNILIKHDVEENGQVVHYGGDSGDYSRYRKGTLWLFNNTIVSYRSGNTTLLGISTNDESSHCFNNIIYAHAGGNSMAITGGEGIVNLEYNWIQTGWIEVHGSNNGTINASNNQEGDSPQFSDLNNEDYSITSESQAVDNGMAIPSDIAPEHPLSFEYFLHQDSKSRVINSNIDIGAFEL
jgi:hypothetical protein